MIMENFGIDFSRYSIKELQQIMELADEEINIKHNEQFTKMSEEFCALAERMRKEFPWVDYPVECCCSECDREDTFNLFHMVSKFKPEDFSF